MPPELLALLDLDLPLIRRDPHYFLPTLDGRHLLMGADRASTKEQYERFFSPADWRADEALQTELGAIRDDLAPAWMAEPLPVEETAERYVRPALRRSFIDLVRGSAVDYLHRFGFASEAVVAMYAVTDGMPGLAGSPYVPGSGHNLLVHNMCRLPGAGGTWMVVRGGMGTVTGRIAAAAVAAGATVGLVRRPRRSSSTAGTSPASRHHAAGSSRRWCWPRPTPTACPVWSVASCRPSCSAGSPAGPGCPAGR